MARFHDKDYLPEIYPSFRDLFSLPCKTSFTMYWHPPSIGCRSEIVRSQNLFTRVDGGSSPHIRASVPHRSRFVHLLHARMFPFIAHAILPHACRYAMI